MRTFIVGGAVRDALLGLPVHDRDWVVVGATPEQMLARGFRPVGKDFPVFLHPGSGEEYALARTERKTGPGYKGFAFRAAADVSLEEDLLRRDLTINAMARSEDGALIDPYGGRHDLAARIFRHVSPAFAEDPVRILRVARFAARFPDFTLAPETLALMRAMVDDGEVDHLVPERVWQELARGLMALQPSRMIATLGACGALARVMPELAHLSDRSPALETASAPAALTCAAIDRAAATAQPLGVRWACLLWEPNATGDAGAPPGHDPDAASRGCERARTLSERLRAPTDCRDLAVMLARELTALRHGGTLDAEAMVRLLERCDALRRPERFALLLDAAACCAAPAAQHQDSDPTAAWRAALDAARSVDAGAVARACADKSQIAQHVHTARVHAVQRAVALFPAQAG